MRVRDRRRGAGRERRDGDRQRRFAAERHHENLRVWLAVFRTVLPPNLAETENDCLPRAAVTERENVQDFESETCWLSTERPPRLICTVTLPVHACALVTLAGIASLPVIVRLALLPLTLVFLTAVVTLVANFATVTLTVVSAVEPSASVTTARSAWRPTSAPVAVRSQEPNGAAVSVQILRAPRNSSTDLTPASAVGVNWIFVVPESVLGAPLNAIAGLARARLRLRAGAGQVTVTVAEADFV